MCGIAGIFSSDLNETIDKGLIQNMTNVLAHRGPDGSGSFHDKGISLGHRRLSIIDVEGGHQPMSSEDDMITITYNGEIYNFETLRKELLDLGCNFRTKSDTEVIIQAYLQWGIEAIDRFNGMFAFGLWDRREKRLLLVRDRMGVKPLYWAKVGQRLIFASEVKAILSYPGFERRANLDALSSYLTFRQPVEDLTYFDGIEKLLPGHYMVYQNGELTTTEYYKLPVNENNQDFGEDYYLEGISDLLSKSVKSHMISDVPLGAFLSGGLDSSLLVALMAKMNKEPVKTFTIGYQEDEYNEAEFAHIVSQHCHTDHHQISLSQNDYLDRWQKLIQHRDAPLSIPHEVPLYQMSLELKKEITVVLSGEGADELFGGYGRVQRSPLDWQKISFARKILTPAIANLLAKNAKKGSLMSLLSIENHMEHFFHVYNWIPFQEKWNLFTKEALKFWIKIKELLEFSEIFLIRQSILILMIKFFTCFKKYILVVF